MPEVYRLEFHDNSGVYTGAPHALYSQLFMDAAHQQDPIDHPRPEEDGISRSAHAYMIFGFASLDAMRAWFNGAERLYLGTYDVLLSKYFARGPILKGKKQLAFYRQSATLIWQKPINHF